ncbi:MAG: fluoride efflux transporter CrcB [Anaerovoracaceae bacterium]
MINILAVGAGGFLGAVLRYLAGMLPVEQPAGFPLTTFCINLLGSFLIGFVSQMAADRQTAGDPATLFLKVGLCGGFTTFSTFALENFTLINENRTGMALLYMILSFSACIAGVLAGSALARRV